MMREASETGALDAAIQRLDRALSQLELRASSLTAQAEAANGDLFDQDRSNLAAQLDAARGRERALEAAGAQASQALERAIVEIRTVLGDEDGAQEASADGAFGGDVSEDE